MNPRYKRLFFKIEGFITIRSKFLLECLKNIISVNNSDSGKDGLQSTSIEKGIVTHNSF